MSLWGIKSKKLCLDLTKYKYCQPVLLLPENFFEGYSIQGIKNQGKFVQGICVRGIRVRGIFEKKKE